ncbi:GspH/FimT family pseudopilin [Arenimonas sp.]|uniref:GspH/FimT family pseudopilin n=1 Tax=Arenimonas sp. TaxID=1872635 RepID=UPI0025BEE5E1|nr:GspH/FimT family pseudopilin [Arenimonas sp.]
MRESGVSMVEMLVCMAVCATLAALAAPVFTDLTQRSLAAGASNQVLGLLNHARSEAVMRRRSTGICPTTDAHSCLRTSEWGLGLMSWVDENANGLRDGDEPVMRVMDTGDFRGQRLLGSPGRSNLGFRADGRSAGQNATLKLCGRDGALSRKIIVNNGGRARIEASRRPEPCPPAT